MDSFISQKKVKLISKDNFESIDPLVEIQDLLILQDLDIKIRAVNFNKIKSRGEIKRGGKRTRKAKFKRENKTGGKISKS